MKLEELITEFAAATGMDNPTAVEGVWKFSADGHVFGVVAGDSGHEAWIFGELPAPAPARAEAFRKAALEANFFMRGTGGAVFSMNPESGAYTLMQSLPLDGTTPEAFFAAVERFVNTLATWKGISGATQEASPVDARPEAGAVPDSRPPERSWNENVEVEPNFPGMMRV